MKNILRNLTIIAVCCTTQLQKAFAVDPDEDAFTQALLSYKWSWDNGVNFRNAAFQLYAGGVMKWTFKSSVEIDTWQITGRRKIHIVYPDGKFADLTFDDKVESFSGFNWHHDRMRGVRLEAIATSGSRAIGGVPSVGAPTSPKVTTYKRGEPQIKILSEQSVNVTGWITAPLNVQVPEDIWENLNFLKEALKDEAAQKPAANDASYTLSVRLCLKMLQFLEERNQAWTRAGGAAVLHQRSNLTQEQRDHLTWPQYMLERDERAERQQNARTADRFQAGHFAVEWNTRATQMRREMQTMYSVFREALRQGKPAAK